MPTSVVRLSAGRSNMNDELQALCFHAGANSIFLGDKLLVTPNPGDSHDHELLRRIDMDLHAVHETVVAIDADDRDRARA
jgi:biotin synthase